MVCRTVFADVLVVLTLGVLTLGVGASLQTLTAQPRKPTALALPRSLSDPRTSETALTDVLPFSSRYTIDVWNSENGLPANAILAMCQTRDGYIWLGTYSGLVRFDGVRFTVYGKTDKGLQEMSKTSNAAAIQVYSLYEDRSGALWSGLAEGGIVRVKGEESVIFNEKNGLPNSKIWSFCELPDKTLLAGSDKGIYRFDNSSNLFVRDSAINDGIQGSEIYLLSRSDGSLWVGTSEGLYQKIGGKTIRHSFNHAFSNKIYCLREDRSGNIWAGTSTAAYKWDGKTMSADTTLPNLESFLSDSKGNLWIGLSNKLICRKNITSDTLTKHEGLADDRIYSLLEDLEGNIWVGTYYGGLQRLKHGKFMTFTAREGLQGEVVYSIRQTKTNALWISYVGGARRMQNGSVTTYNSRNGLGNTTVRDVCEYSDGTTWIATYGGLYRLTGKTLQSYSAKNGLASERIRVLTETTDSTLWIGTNNGLNTYRNGVFGTYKKPDGTPISVGVLSLFEDSKKQLWVATDGEGVMAIQGSTFTVYKKKEGLGNNTAFCFHEDSNGDIWVGTKDGLSRIHNGTITTFTTTDGLADNQIFQLVEDEFGYFWIGCNKGIMRVQREELNQRANKKTGKVVCALYNRSDGMSSNTTNAPAAACRTSDGRIWFPTDKGVTVVEPKNFRFNTSVPSVFVPHIFVDGVRSTQSNNLALEANVQRLEFHYTALSFFAPEKVLFKYRLDGYDNDWIDAGSRRVAYYTSLPRGREYRFRVIACNNDGIWNDEGVSVGLYIKPYWYETSWFYITCGLLVLGAAFGLYRSRVHAIEARAQALEETVRLRTSELQAANAEISRRMEVQTEQTHQIERANKDLQTTNEQLDKANRLKTQLLSMAAHDLKNPLSAIIGLSEIALTTIPQENQARELLGHIQTTAERMGLLIKDLLDAATIELGNIALHKHDVILPLLVYGIAERYQLNAKHKGQHINIETVDDLVVTADPSRLEQIFDNLLSNAVKYSPHGKNIWVRVRKTPTTARVEVQDEGPGISAEDQKILFGFFQRLSARPTGGESSNGVGLAIVRKIVDLHGGNIWVESEVGNGTTFIVELPLAKEKEQNS
ncbi:MAG: hypothetical protein JNN25_19660 [Candidatus Kapabacteria bacterium]|nr:hypothetical protein [Candidatus Kapabacteria bacterium]